MISLFFENKVINAIMNLVIKMLGRIKDNEEKFDNILKCVSELEEALGNFKNIKQNLIEVNNYYGSKEWFLDKEKVEKKKLKVKSGILSEDGFWNTITDIEELCDDMKEVADNTKNIFSSNNNDIM